MPAVTAKGKSTELVDEEIHNILRNERRRHTITYLREADDKVSVRDLAEHIAEIETDTSPPPRNARNSAYISLHQTHLPKLDTHGIVEYDTTGKAVTLGDEIHQLEPYLDGIRESPSPWALFYLSYSVVGALVILGALVDVPVVSTLTPATWTAGYTVVTGSLLGFEFARQRGLIETSILDG